jgi:predicted CXXCH cytochrome family protein
LARRLTALAALLALSAGSGMAQAATPPDYVGSAACAECHEAAAAAWSGSHHALAWTLPGPDTVVADFDGTSFTHDGMTARFRIEGAHYHVEVSEKDGSKRDYRVHSVAGIAPLQQYLLETEPGRLQSFDVVWDTERERWFHLYPDSDLPPGDGLHWTGPYKNWNARCAECHATGYAKNYDPKRRRYASTQAEIGVGCEACHGPGSGHLDWAAGEEIEPTLGPAGFSLDLARAGVEATIQQCAGCHSRREAHGDGNPLPGTPYHDAYTLATLRPGLYHADGQILDEVYVYGSFLQSKMYANGVSCMNCHDAHSARLVADGNAVCVQCHSPAGNPLFPAAARGDYDSPAHHFHEPGSAGAQCTSCHMIERVYMGVDGRRDHSFRVPRPDLAAATGSPDACTDCHTARAPEWAAAAIAERFPDSTRRGPHYGEVFARGRADPPAAQGDLVAIALDDSQPGIVRATAAWLAAQSADAATATQLAPLLDDPDPLPRGAALLVQRSAPPHEGVPRVVGLLSDPYRSVRIEAAKQMVNAPIARMPANVEAAIATAMGEWQAAMANRIDFPETHLVLGGMALSMRNIPAAEGAFREATRLDPQRSEAWVMLARIAAATRGSDAAREVIAEALAASPGDAAIRQLADELGPAP